MEFSDNYTSGDQSSFSMPTNPYTIGSRDYPPPLSHSSVRPDMIVPPSLQATPITTVPSSVPNMTQLMPTGSESLSVTPVTNDDANNTVKATTDKSDDNGMTVEALQVVNNTGISSEAVKSGTGTHAKLVLRIKKTKFINNEDESESFEKQEISKNDSYCWVCHEGGEVLCCDKCPRVFHLQCSGLNIVPADDEDWVCPVCKNISRKPKRSRPTNLKELLLMAIHRMMFPGTEIFQKDIPEDIIGHYKEYIFHPMHLGMIKEKVMASGFHSTREFLHETEWILHNCIIYNGGKHALTKIAKGIVKVCKEDMREIELCPSCYGLTVKQPADWFCIPCNPPHKVILAKVRGYPLWPAKLISETSDKCDVRFFGQHDRSLVQRSSISPLNGPPPAPATKSSHWTLAMEELTKYRQNINLMLKHIDSGKTPEQFIAEKMAIEAPPPPPIAKHRDNNKFPRFPKKERPDKTGGGRGQTHPGSPAHPVGTHNGYSNERGESESRESSIAPSMSVSNHIPCSPQIVMVNPPFSESDESGTIHGNSASFARSIDMSGNYSEPSSPGSDNLTIDLGGQDEKKRMAPSASKSMLKNKKTSKLPPEAYYNPQYGYGSCSMDVQMITPPSGYHSTSSQSARPGEALNLITRNLNKRAMEQYPSNGNSTPGSGGSQDDSEAMETAFSSIIPPGKRAIAVVDPNSKRQIKRKRGTDISPVKTSTRRRKKDQVQQSFPSYSTYEGSTPLITGYETTNGLNLGGSQMGMDYVDDAPPIQYGEGLLADTMRTIDQSYAARLDGLVGSNSDMGYQYFSEKLMSSIKTVVIEMLSIFESKGKAGAKQIKEHLHTAWPVPDSRSQLENLRATLKEEMKASLEVVRTSAEMERQQVVSEVKRQAEVEKELAIQDTKKKKWCSYCWKEARYNCCWNANYCNEVCQQSHWPEHKINCMQILSRTPGPLETASSQKMSSPNVNNSSMFPFEIPQNTSSDIGEFGGGTPMGGVPVSGGMPSLKSNNEGCSSAYTTSPLIGESSLEEIQMATSVIIVPPEETMCNIENIGNELTIECLPNTQLNHIQSHHHASLLVHPSSPQNFTSSVMMSSHPSPGISLPPPSPTHSTPLHNIPMHAQPVSPATSPQSISNPPPPFHHVTNTFSWPYQQPIPGLSHDLSHALPLLPQVTAQTPTSQPNSFFRNF